ncbi:MAG: cytochrome C [Gammaproteobacteria bacterium]|jgi:hypothetical protein
MKSLLLASLAAVFLFTWSAQSSAGTNGRKVYQSECGACHVPYPAVFLTASSWDALLRKLDDHFGDNAELGAENLASIKTFLEQNSYDKSNIRKRYGNRFDTPGTPLRVSETRFFKAVHGEVPDRYVTGNPKVKSYSRCGACHGGAQQGSFDEDEVRIPR